MPTISVTPSWDRTAFLMTSYVDDGLGGAALAGMTNDCLGLFQSPLRFGGSQPSGGGAVVGDDFFWISGIKFDVSSLPVLSSISITSVVLRLHINTVQNFVVNGINGTGIESLGCTSGDLYQALSGSVPYATVTPTAAVYMDVTLNDSAKNAILAGDGTFSVNLYNGSLDISGSVDSMDGGFPPSLIVTYEFLPPANDVRQRLSSLLAARLNTVPVFHGRVYEYQPSSLIEYPSCSVISSGFFDDVVDQKYNVRDYQFTVVVWANLGKGKRQQGEAIRRRVEDAVFAVLDNYQDFGGNVLWSKPENAGWGYSVDPGIAYLIINIDARKQRVMSFS